MKSTFPWPVRLGALAVAGAFVLLPPATHAQRRKAPAPEIPPPVQPLAVKVERGQTCEITLRTHGRKLEMLKYLVRTPPEHGRLTEPRPVGRDLSVVTYTPPAGLEIVRDRFSYAVQNAAGVSAAAEVVITIIDAPPALELPASLDFPPVLAGGSVAKPLEIANRGGGIAEGRVSVEAPWKVEGSAKYRLTAGARAVFRLLFTPTEPGKFDRLVRFSSQPDTGMAVHGEARAALDATPAQVVLQHAADDPVRTGAFELSNQTDTERRVVLTADARLLVLPEIAVPAQGTARVAVRSAAGDVAALEGEVRAEVPGLTLRVPVRAAAVGAIVRAHGGRVAFGRVDAATAAGASVVLENIGGTATTATLAISAPFEAGQASVPLSPGERQTVALRTQPAAAGKYQASLTVKTDRQKLEIPVEAEFFAPAPAPAPQAAVAAAGPAVVRTPASPPAPVEEKPEAPRREPAHRRIAEGVKVTGLKRAGCTIEWPVALSEATQFRVERLRLAVAPGGALQRLWEELPGTVIRREGDRHLAVLKDLRPATVYRLRVMPVGPDPATSLPLFTQNLTTPRARPGLWSSVTPLRALLLVLVICAALLVRQRLAARHHA